MNLIVNGVMEKINRLIVQRSTCIHYLQYITGSVTRREEL